MDNDMTLSSHCPKNNLMHHIKTGPVTVGADPTEYVYFLGQYVYLNKNRTYTVAFTPAVAESVFLCRDSDNF